MRPASDVPAQVVVTTDETRESLIESLGNLCNSAKAERRRGHAGVHGSRYAQLHASMNTVLDAIDFRTRLGLD